MREIKFRAVRLDTGEWIYGDLHLHSPFPHIHSTRGEKAKIDTNTIGQSAGLRDKNGKEVYEGDIVKFIPNSNSREFVRPIIWLGTSFTFGEMSPLNYPSGCYEVVGNIHDNPELMKSDCE